MKKNPDIDLQIGINIEKNKYEYNKFTENILALLNKATNHVKNGQTIRFIAIIKLEKW